MKMKDLVKLCDPTLGLCIQKQNAAPTEEYLFDGYPNEVSTDWFDRVVVAITDTQYGTGITAVVA